MPLPMFQAWMPGAPFVLCGLSGVRPCPAVGVGYGRVHETGPLNVAVARWDTDHSGTTLLEYIGPNIQRKHARGP